jgi:hypothetical protein
MEHLGIFTIAVSESVHSSTYSGTIRNGRTRCVVKRSTKNLTVVWLQFRYVVSEHNAVPSVATLAFTPTSAVPLRPCTHPVCITFSL